MKLYMLKYLFLLLGLTLAFFECNYLKIEPLGTDKYDQCLNSLNKVVCEFSHDKMNIGCDSPCLVTFHVNKSINAKTYLWDFGDGQTSKEMNPKHIYQKTGGLQVKLTASSDSCSTTVLGSVNIVSPSLLNPIVDFTPLNNNVPAPVVIKFKNNSRGADTTKYRWYFGDGDSSHLVEPSHTYNVQGTYTVTLKAYNAANLEISKSVVVTITGSTFTKILIEPNNDNLVSADMVINDNGFAIVGTGSSQNIPEKTYGYITLMDFSGNFGQYYKYNLNTNTFNTIIRANDGGLVIAGTTKSNITPLNMLALKLSADLRGYPWILIVPGGENAFSNSIENRLDGGYLVCGSQNRTTPIEGNIFIIKISSEGSLQEQPTRYNGNYNDQGLVIKQNSFGKVSILGTRSGVSVLFQTNSSFSPPASLIINSQVLSNSMSLTKDGGYVFCGNDINTNTLIVFKTDNSGNIIWQKSSYAANFTPLSIQQCNDGGYVICGGSTLLKVDNLGNQVWFKNLDQLSNAKKALETPDGGYIVVGTKLSGSTQTQIIVTKTDKNGN